MNADFHKFRAQRIHQILAMRTACLGRRAGIELGDRLRLHAWWYILGVFFKGARSYAFEHIRECLGHAIGCDDLAVAERGLGRVAFSSDRIDRRYRTEELFADSVAGLEHRRTALPCGIDDQYGR